MPLGLAAWFRGVGVNNVHELTWWQELGHPNSSVTLACTPAQASPATLLTQHMLVLTADLQARAEVIPGDHLVFLLAMGCYMALGPCHMQPSFALYCDVCPSLLPLQGVE